MGSWRTRRLKAFCTGIGSEQNDTSGSVTFFRLGPLFSWDPSQSLAGTIRQDSCVPPRIAIRENDPKTTVMVLSSFLPPSKPTLVIMVVLVLCGCRNRSANQLHPIESLQPYASEERVPITARGGIVSSDLEMVADRLRAAKQVVRIGSQEGSDDYRIGRIVDVAFDTDGNVLVLDRQPSLIRRYDSTGASLPVWSKPGPGPGELESPKALDLMHDTLLVLDLRKQALLRFSHGSVAGSSIPVLGVRQFCTSDDYQARFIDERGGATIQILSEDGSVHSKIDVSYNADVPITMSQLSRGVMACLPETVISSLSALPSIYAHDRDGKLLWISAVQDFTPRVFTQEAKSDGIYISGSFEGDHISALTAVASGYLLVQVTRSTAESVAQGKEYASVQPYLIDSESGQGVFVSDSLPEIAAATNEYLAATHLLPFSQVTLLKY